MSASVGSGEGAAQGSPARPARRWGLKLLQVAATVGAFTYLFYAADWNEMRGAYERASAAAFMGACGAYYMALVLGTLRWRMLLTALGAVKMIPLLQLFRFYVIGQFYNTYVPGGVGGDVVRGFAARTAFGEQGTAGSLATVLVERAMGLGGMFVVVAGTTLFFPLRGAEQLTWVGGLGLLFAIGGFVGLAFARRIAGHVPGGIGRLLERLPVLTVYWPVAPAILTSVLTHVAAAMAGHILIVTVVPTVAITESLTVVPLALASAYLPISVGGVGVVELALVGLLEMVGVESGDALVAALMMRLCQWVIAAPGGLLVLLGGVPREGAASKP